MWADCFRIAAKDKSASQELARHQENLNSLQVYQVQAIEVKRYVMDDGSKVYGRAHEGSVVLRERVSTENGLHI